MANLLSIREFTRRYYGYSRLYSLMASLRVCAEKDPRVKEQVEKIAEGTTLYLTTFPARKVLMCKFWVSWKQNKIWRLKKFLWERWNSGGLGTFFTIIYIYYLIGIYFLIINKD